MSYRRAFFGSSVAFLLAFMGQVISPPAAAQIPTEFTNLEVLPKDIDQRELVGTMRSFAMSLGVRCNHCHVGEDPDDLSGYDFAADDKEAKKVARVMMQMTREINDSLLPRTGRTDLLQVRCVTCHHGLAKPQTLSQVLSEVLESAGPAAVITRYEELRAEYYGKGVYDFGPGALASLAETRVRGGDTEGALALIEHDLELHPDQANLHFMMGEIHLRGQDKASALAAYEKGLELDPDSSWGRRRVEMLKAEE